MSSVPAPAGRARGEHSGGRGCFPNPTAGRNSIGNKLLASEGSCRGWRRRRKLNNSKKRAWRDRTGKKKSSLASGGVAEHLLSARVSTGNDEGGSSDVCMGCPFVGASVCGYTSPQDPIPLSVRAHLRAAAGRSPPCCILGLRRGTGGAGRAPTRCVLPLFPRFLCLWGAGGSVLCLFEVRMGNPSQPNRLPVRGGLVPSFFFRRRAVSAVKRGGL